MGLSAKEMDDVGELVNMAFLTSFSNTPSIHHEKLLKFSFGLMRQEVPYFLFSGQLEGTKRLISLMYDDTVIQDFVLQVTMHVFAKFGDTKNRYPALVENLAESIGYIQPPAPKNKQEEETSPIALTSPALLERLPDVSDVTDILLYNRWAVTMVLLMLYLMTPDDLAELRLEKMRREAEEAKLTARKVPS